MKKIGLQMNVLMGLSMSLGLSIVGNITGGGQRPVPAIIIGIVTSFIISFIISLIIGLIVPMKKVGDGVCQLFKVSANAIGGKILSALASDIIYTPIITAAMTFMAHTMAVKQAGEHAANVPSWPQMFVPSLIICFIVGFILIFILQPLYLKAILKKNGIEM